MNRTLIMPLVAAAAFSFMTWHLVKTHQSLPDLDPPAPPSRNPYSQTIAGSGLVEPRSENIKVAAVMPGTVVKVNVHVGQKVRAGDVLFQLDDRQRQAELAVQQAAVAEAQANLHRAVSAPRAEDLPASEARVEKAKAEVAAQRDLWNRSKELVNQKAISEEENVQRQQGYLAATATLSQAEAEDARLRAGTWKEDLAVLECDRCNQHVLRGVIA